MTDTPRNLRPYQEILQNGFGRPTPGAATDADVTGRSAKQDEALLRSLRRSRRQAFTNKVQEATRYGIIHWRMGRPTFVNEVEWRVIRERQSGRTHSSIAYSLDIPVETVLEIEEATLAKLKRDTSHRPKRSDRMMPRR